MYTIYYTVVNLYTMSVIVVYCMLLLLALAYQHQITSIGLLAVFLLALSYQQCFYQHCHISSVSISIGLLAVFLLAVFLLELFYYYCFYYLCILKTFYYLSIKHMSLVWHSTLHNNKKYSCCLHFTLMLFNYDYVDVIMI